MIISAIDPAPSPDEWERALREVPNKEVLEMYEGACMRLEALARWTALIAIAEKIIRERGIVD